MRLQNWLLIGVLLLSGCGFHLRGSFVIPEGLKQLIVMPDDPYQPFQRQLRYTLKKRGIDIVAPGYKAPTLTIHDENYSQQVLGLSPTGQAQQFRMFLNLSYSLKSIKGQELRANTIRVSKDFSADPNTVLSNDSGISIYKQELQQEAILQLIRQLTTIKALHTQTEGVATAEPN